jgi:hypothetical protein
MVTGFEDQQMKFMQLFITEMRMLNEKLTRIEERLTEMRDEFRIANERRAVK